MGKMYPLWPLQTNELGKTAYLKPYNNVPSSWFFKMVNTPVYIIMLVYNYINKKVYFLNIKEWKLRLPKARVLIQPLQTNDFYMKTAHKEWNVALLKSFLTFKHMSKEQ